MAFVVKELGSGRRPVVWGVYQDKRSALAGAREMRRLWRVTYTRRGEKPPRVGGSSGGRFVVAKLAADTFAPRRRRR